MAEWAYVITPEDRESFKSCRRAWDLGSRERQNYEPAKPRRPFNFEIAIHDALAVYYFPGMWEWNRQIVFPLVIEGFIKSMRRQRDGYQEKYGFSAQEEKDWEEHMVLGEALLQHYFEWAPTVDRFEPIRLGPQFDVNIPDPENPGQDMVAPGRIPPVPIRYRGHFDLLTIDGYNAYWIVDHRVVKENWTELDQLLLDERGIAACWAWQQYSPGIEIAGVIYTELRKLVQEYMSQPDEQSRPSLSRDTHRTDVPKATHRRMYMQAVRKPNQRIKREGNEVFRRTQIARSQEELKNFGRQVALEASEITASGLRIYPNPSRENCTSCAFLKPCMAMYDGSDVEGILEASYRKRDQEEKEEGRLGGATWSLNRGAMPPKFGR